MAKLVLHPITERAVKEYIDHPGHALLLSGPHGSGKASLTKHIVMSILALDDSKDSKADGATSAYENHAYIRILRPIESKQIPVESVRALQQFLSLKIPGASQGSIARAVVVEDADLLTTEAQNALLKTLEEPPSDTILILMAPSVESVLPTIRSRVRQLAVLPPGADRLSEHFQALGHNAEDISRALMLSGELPGLSAELLVDGADHPLSLATTHARGILGSKTYERLLLVDSLSKQKTLCADIIFVLTQMSRMALMRAQQPASRQRWQRVLVAAYRAGEQLNHNTQAKLVLTNLMLEM